MRKRRDFVKPPIRFSILEDQLFLGRSQMADGHAIRQDATPFHIKHFQSRDRREQRIVSATRVERERLK
ncbi:hypothetical protein KC221_28485, partial [Mycobacterium tuberculosis]|nr:hypothetical protein [Mycobacterium tuberculosis]